MHSNSNKNAKSTKDISPLCFILSKKLHFDSFASCGSTHKIEFAEQIHKFREHVSQNLYKEEKMCLQGAFFLRNSIESVVSIERLLEKR